MMSTANAVTFLVMLICSQFSISTCSASRASGSEKPTTADGSTWFLPTDIKPTDYFLTIEPYFPPIVPLNDPKVFTFDGHYELWLSSDAETSQIVMHSMNINISESTIVLRETSPGAKELPKPTVKYNVAYQTVVFNSSVPLKSNHNYSLSFKYTGVLGNSMEGFYRSSYFENGVTKWMAVTDFECCAARMALPCFDEPRFKAVYHIAIIHPSNMTALANNMKANELDLGNGTVNTTFLPSPKMSSYLLAFTVCGFKNTSNDSMKDVLFRIWARPSAITETLFATAAGPKVLPFYAHYFNKSFPLPKQDMLAVPDFEAGAMENWGLITYRETALLYNNQTCWRTNRDRVATVVAHELSHQWFGDLVTMKWWDDIWLNEGFARLFEYVGTGYILDENMWMAQEFPVQEVQTALALDQLNSSHAICQYVSSPQTIEQIFDTITYSKGASVIRMLMETLNINISNTFQLSLKKYIARYQYQNAEHADLWNTINEVVQATETPIGWDGKLLNVTAMMDPWILQSGFPLVTVTRNYTTRSATLSQRRFLMQMHVTPELDFKWYVPIWYRGKTDQREKFVWLDRTSNTTITDLADEWLVVNYGERSFFRVNYDVENWKLLRDQLTKDPEAINVVNRAQILDDSQNLARVGLIDYELALNLTEYLKNETSYLPWKALQRSLSYYQNMLMYKGEFIYYRKYLLRQLQDAYSRLNMLKNEYFKHFVFDQTCQLHYRDCVDTAKAKFENYKKDCGGPSAESSNCSRVEPVYRKTVYCIGAATGGYENWNFLWNMYQRETQPVESVSLLRGICCTRIPCLITEILEQSFAKHPVIRKQNIGYVYDNFQTNAVAIKMIWDFFVNNIDAILAEHGNNFGNMKRIIQGATSTFNTPYQVQMMEDFYKHHPALGTGISTYKQQLEHAKGNVNWMTKHFDTFARWLKQRAVATP